MIRLSRPKGYGEIKPLCGSTGQPIRCTPPCIATTEKEYRADCTECPTKTCRATKCDQ